MQKGVDKNLGEEGFFFCLGATERIDPMLELTVGQVLIKVACFFLTNSPESSLTLLTRNHPMPSVTSRSVCLANQYCCNTDTAVQDHAGGGRSVVRLLLPAVPSTFRAIIGY